MDAGGMTTRLRASSRVQAIRVLVDDFLLYTEGLPREDVARIAGVNLATVRRWERSGARKIQGAVEQRLRAHLGEPSPPGSRPLSLTA